MELQPRSAAPKLEAETVPENDVEGRADRFSQRAIDPAAIYVARPECVARSEQLLDNWTISPTQASFEERCQQRGLGATRHDAFAGGLELVSGLDPPDPDPERTVAGLEERGAPGREVLGIRRRIVLHRGDLESGIFQHPLAGQLVPTQQGSSYPNPSRSSVIRGATCGFVAFTQNV